MEACGRQRRAAMLGHPINSPCLQPERRSEWRLRALNRPSPQPLSRGERGLEPAGGSFEGMKLEPANAFKVRLLEARLSKA